MQSVLLEKSKNLKEHMFYKQLLVIFCLVESRQQIQMSSKQ